MKTRTAATYPLTSATLILASFHLPFDSESLCCEALKQRSAVLAIGPLYRRSVTLKTSGRDFAEVDSTTDECWRKNCAGNHDGQRHTDNGKNKAVVAVLEIGFLVGVVEQ